MLEPDGQDSSNKPSGAEANLPRVAFPWYLVRTKPRQEHLACCQLLRQDYQVYLPRYRQWINRNGDWQPEETPWFPGYLFVRQSDEEQSLAPVRSTYGVLNLVSFGPQPQPVGDALINRLKKLEQQQQQKYDKEFRLPFKPGDRVLIDQGPLRGRRGIVSRCEQERVQVLLSMLGRTVKANVKAGALVVG